MKSSLREARSEVVRERVLDGVAALLTAGEDLTFAKVAKEAGVPERTVYRHFATREALLAAVFAWANRRIGFDGELPTDGRGAVALVRRAFPGFDAVAPVIRELLLTPEGLLARLSSREQRQSAAVTLVRAEAPGLGAEDTRRVAAVVQLLTTASTWQTLRDFWEMDGTESAESAALALELLLEGARARGVALTAPTTAAHATGGIASETNASETNVP
ncbi:MULTISPECIES: TetR/AcrR family transcriptional regulator [unclassified Parafrankia]|uniref:TetR/AcrR family transcriptional regulator n=1 Tax=unclassified Parafrankia TaxID=2994368 RepID=UPI000DA5C8D5|nr:MULTISPECIES: TetR/AcrR family transcriptional regulator [unclassified Parafrankia]TCJ34943.1 TetR/AcrR family transcriptional regulator [Parafrankia sp. BMG5.11]SQE00417.1 Transcriptional regulator, TetR family [Parafrankia sp. Ea1.12]